MGHPVNGPEHLQRANAELAAGDYRSADTHALIAIAAFLQQLLERGDSGRGRS